MKGTLTDQYDDGRHAISQQLSSPNGNRDTGVDSLHRDVLCDIPEAAFDVQRTPNVSVRIGEDVLCPAGTLEAHTAHFFCRRWVIKAQIQLVTDADVESVRHGRIQQDVGALGAGAGR